MNEVLKAIGERFTCRDFCSEALSAEQINALVTAALASPSAMNLQPWHIVVVTDAAFIDELDAAAMEHVKKDAEWHKRMMERGGKVFYNAPCIIFIAQDGSEAAPLDCGIVSQNIALAAHSMGLGSVICGMARIPLSGDSGAGFLERLQFPEGYSFGMSVCVGKIKSGKAPHEIDANKVTYIR
ncbi:MAG: nitroreductase family protein [Defluviitaleaceae bacterium]|nr:nitroreductase family protein [Defluviitaleaceae bacterium]